MTMLADGYVITESMIPSCFYILRFVLCCIILMRMLAEGVRYGGTEGSSMCCVLHCYYCSYTPASDNETAKEGYVTDSVEHLFSVLRTVIL